MMSAFKLAPLFLITGPVFIVLGAIYSKLEWAAGGASLIALGTVLAMKWRRQAADSRFRAKSPAEGIGGEPQTE